ncbi:MAG: alpha/beta hydrolase [Pseudomonadota bacterium]
MMWTTRPRSETAPLAAIVAGSGPQVLLLHGVGLRAEAWAAQLDDLARCNIVRAVDLPGHGRSAAIAGKPTLSDYTHALSACLQDNTVVIGHSFGAMIALDLAVKHPHQVSGVAALNAIYGRDPMARAAVIERADHLDDTVAPDPALPLQRWFGAAQTPQRDACAHWLGTVDPTGYKAAYHVFAHADGPSRVDLASLHCPALFLTGAEEPNSTPAMSRAMAEITPKGQAHIVEGAAHMMPMTHAKEVNDALHAFLTRCRQ